jgi:hypothetical protein
MYRTILAATTLVLAVMLARSSEAQEGPATRPTGNKEPTALDVFVKNFHLARSSADEDANTGAAFSLLKSNSDNRDADTPETLYSADFYMKYDLAKAADSRYSTLYAFAEGHISGKKTDAEDVWRFGIGSEGIFPLNHPGGVEGFYVKLDLELDADRDFRTQQIILDLSASPNIPTLAIGKIISWGERVAFQKPDGNADIKRETEFFWRPYVGVEGGQTIKGGNTNDVPDTVIRPYGSVDARLRFNPFKVTQSIESIDLFVQDKLYVLANVDGTPTRNLFVGGIDVRINQTFGIQFAYTIGREEPEFKKVETLEVGFSIKF